MRAFVPASPAAWRCAAHAHNASSETIAAATAPFVAFHSIVDSSAAVRRKRRRAAALDAAVRRCARG
jgi:hypothetical protein